MIRDRIQRLISTERKPPPERAVNTPAVRRSNAVFWAFCKTAAGEGSTLDCYLGIDGTGPEIEVNFTLLNCSDLEDGHLSLADGTPIPVMLRGGGWWCIIPIEGTGDC